MGQPCEGLRPLGVGVPPVGVYRCPPSRSSPLDLAWLLSPMTRHFHGPGLWVRGGFVEMLLLQLESQPPLRPGIEHEWPEHTSLKRGFIVQKAIHSKNPR
jgi:hypothetical protein